MANKIDIKKTLLHTCNAVIWLGIGVCLVIVWIPILILKWIDD